MGYTSFSKTLVERHLSNVKSIIDFGACIDYTEPGTPFISDWYRSKGIHYTCIDLAGDNNAIKFNWSYPIGSKVRYDLVCDFGSSEHSACSDEYTTAEFEGNIHSVYPIEPKETLFAFYNCWLNKFELCDIGGLIISENPKQGNWPEHGFSYITQEFYKQLERYSGLRIVEMGEDAACGNVTDGWNIWSVLVRVNDTFPTFEEFSKFDIKDK